MNLNSSNLSHPRVQWEIRAMMMQAVEMSKGQMFGFADVKNAAGKTIMRIMHWRGCVGAMMFLVGDQNVTDKVLKALRASQ